MKKAAEKLILSLIDELEGGFQNGFDDLLEFMKSNITQLLKVASEPKQANLFTNFGLPPIMNFINHCQNNAETIRSSNIPTQINRKQLQEQEDVEMIEETKEVAENLQSRYARILA